MTSSFLNPPIAERRRSDRIRSDVTASSFTLTLLFMMTVAAACSDHPVLWHLIGTIPLTAVFVVTALFEKRLGRRRAARSGRSSVLECVRLVAALRSRRARTRTGRLERVFAEGSSFAKASADTSHKMRAVFGVASRTRSGRDELTTADKPSSRPGYGIAQALDRRARRSPCGGGLLVQVET